MSHHPTIACDDCRALLGGYVLNALEPDEAETVRAHLGGCAACAREHAELAPLPAMLDVAGSADVAPVRPPEALEEAVVDRFVRERPPPALRRSRARRWLARPLPVAAAAAAAAVAITLGVSAGFHGGASSSHNYGAWLHGSAAAPNARAYARLTPRSEGTGVQLDVRGLRAAPAGAVYELWCIEDSGERVSAGTFRTAADGTAHVRLTTAAQLGQYRRLSIERRAAARGAGRPVLAGSIEY